MCWAPSLHIILFKAIISAFLVSLPCNKLDLYQSPSVGDLQALVPSPTRLSLVVSLKPEKKNQKRGKKQKRDVGRASIGVLFRIVWLNIEFEGTGFRWLYSIYQGHLFFQKDTYARCFWYATALAWCIWSSSPTASLRFPRRIPRRRCCSPWPPACDLIRSDHGSGRFRVPGSQWVAATCFDSFRGRVPLESQPEMDAPFSPLATHLSLGKPTRKC